MQLDKTSYYDLSIFNRDEEYSLFHRLDFTTTAGGRDYLRQLFSKPLQDITAIQNRQKALKYILDLESKWPSIISNGTIVVVENYMEAHIEPISTTEGPALWLNAVITKTLYAPDFSFIKFSFTQLVNLLRGFRAFIDVFNSDDAPKVLKTMLDRAQHLLNQRDFSDILQAEATGTLNFVQILRYDHYIRRRHKKVIIELVTLYQQLDAYYAMAKAIRHFNLQFPIFSGSTRPQVKASQLYHLILDTPVAYDLTLDEQQHFMFLTGANMAGKTTFIRAVGLAVFLAHIGMGVPAAAMELSFFHGIFSNIQVQDNIFKGESYFYSEVLRIKNTITQVTDGKNWLVLIDEMFKGTNIEDARNCSLAVIRGLLRSSNCLFILSTHLYEIAEDLSQEKRIQFKYFESQVIEDNLHFTYQLKDGIAKEKIGYLILKREKVLDLLDQIR
ncbi:MutS-related protein [Chitinophaga nivalis]|uniref:DNA mismatch repair protein MutS n=1 Tax=Chitinophaga nivalis TaxID=2991709 RepID=A0ABT3IT22_9BACT|nr:DNA mismatch repair protein MutS [Chitinophaga nivalis]MCW3463189.1 DNA mismatch repair protein MutS [Chitinophaga nivalis]MCW3487121.1 DNA mismatch repair protein MutS [Chitinophaga nivalis]